jgi:hypothetical protein
VSAVGPTTAARAPRSSTRPPGATYPALPVSRTSERPRKGRAHSRVGRLRSSAVLQPLPYSPTGVSVTSRKHLSSSKSDIDLPAGHRHRGNHRRRPYKTRTGDVRHRRPTPLRTRTTPNGGSAMSAPADQLVDQQLPLIDMEAGVNRKPPRCSHPPAVSSVAVVRDMAAETLAFGRSARRSQHPRATSAHRHGNSVAVGSRPMCIAPRASRSPSVVTATPNTSSVSCMPTWGNVIPGTTKAAVGVRREQLWVTGGLAPACLLLPLCFSRFSKPAARRLESPPRTRATPVASLDAYSNKQRHAGRCVADLRERQKCQPPKTTPSAARRRS